MRIDDTTSLEIWIETIASLIEKDAEPDPQIVAHFLEHPELAFLVVDYLNTLEETTGKENPPTYSACILVLDICITQLHALHEYGNKLTKKILVKLMDNLAKVMHMSTHSISFWLPLLNPFYEAQIELTASLKDAYFELANREEDNFPEINEFAHQDAIRDLLQELGDLSTFDIAEHFFAQSYAMPADFFIDLLMDLFTIPEGVEVGILTLLHPNPLVREVVFETIDGLIDSVLLSSRSLTRLQTIMSWYPEATQAQFARWIKSQRKKGVVFDAESIPTSLQIKASEVDGSSSQGIFMHVKRGRKNQLCGLLFKDGLGLKDAWLTGNILSKEVTRYYKDAFDDTVTLKVVDLPYLLKMSEHFLAQTLAAGSMPDLHFLEIQELLGVHFKPNPLDINHLFREMAVKIAPFTEEVMQQSFKRSQTWIKNKKFTASWYMEDPKIDKVVNRCSSFVEGVRVCRIKDAVEALLKEDIEYYRDKWAFHFLWMTLWVEAHAKPHEKTAQDCFLIAYALHEGYPFESIPIMRAICHQSVLNSIETMHERGTYLNQESGV